MRASNNKKGMLTTRILGLFLTAAMPLSFSAITSSTVIAVESNNLFESLNEKVAEFSKKIEKPQIISFYEFSEEALGQVSLDQLIQLEPEKRSAFNLGHGLHALQDVLDKVEESDFLNTRLLEKLATNNPDFQESIASFAAAKAYEYYFYAMEFIANKTATLVCTSPKVLLDLEVAKRLNNVMIASFAYQNFYWSQLKFHEDQLSDLKKKCQDEYQILEFGETGNAGKNKEKQDRTARYKSEKEELDKQLSDTEASRQNAENSTTKSTSHIKSLIVTIEDLQRKLKELEEKYNAEIKKIDDDLAKKKTEDKQKIDQLIKENQVKADLTKKYLSYFFDGLGNSLGTKMYYRWKNGLPQNREDFDFGQFDLMLAKTPQLLVDARYLMYEKIQEAVESHSGKITNYPKAIILASFLNHLGFTSEDQITFGSLIEARKKKIELAKVSTEPQTTGLLNSNELPLQQTSGTIFSPSVKEDSGDVKEVSSRNSDSHMSFEEVIPEDVNVQENPITTVQPLGIQPVVDERNLLTTETVSSPSTGSKKKTTKGN